MSDISNLKTKLVELERDQRELGLKLYDVTKTMKKIETTVAKTAGELKDLNPLIEELLATLRPSKKSKQELVYIG